jgi:hypothetical protein
MNNKEMKEILIEAEKCTLTNSNHEGKYEKRVNTRRFEEEITNIAKSYIMNAELKEALEKSIMDNYDSNKPLSFTLFFILFTMCRRQNYSDILELANQYEEMFSNYAIMKHISLMAVLVKCTNTKKMYREIKKYSGLVKAKGELYDFTNHTGVLNAYSALICKYFEYELDKRKDYDNKELLNLGLECIEKAITIETIEKGSANQVYSKFYLNKGRLLILLEKYNEGDAEILRAIELLPNSKDRNYKVNEYNQYLVKSSIIRAFDLNEEKFKELDKIKVSNYKSIALMTTLLGFLLGTINIFTTITNQFTLFMLMLGYCSLLLILVGTILLGFSLTFKERKRIFYIYDVILIVVGIIVFVITMIMINKG